MISQNDQYDKMVAWWLNIKCFNFENKITNTNKCFWAICLHRGRLALLRLIHDHLKLCTNCVDYSMFKEGQFLIKENWGV